MLSSITTACHAIVIKSSLPAVNGSTMALAWYSNVLSAIVMLPLSFICAEGAEIVRTWGDVELLKRFLWGSAVTVSSFVFPSPVPALALPHPLAVLVP